MMLRLLLLFALAGTISSESIIPQTCQYQGSSEAENSLFDVDYYSSKNYGSSGYLYEFTLQSREFAADDCETPSCCDPAASFEYVEMSLSSECGTPETNFITDVQIDRKPLNRSEYSIEPTNYGGTKITIKMPPNVPGKDIRLGILISPNSVCGTKTYASDNGYSGPCKPEGCPVSLTTRNPQYANCCTTTSLTNQDPQYPKVVTMPANTGIDVSSYPISLMVLGDWGSPPYSSGYTRVKFVGKAMATVARQYRPQAVLNTGDNFYESGLIYNRSSPATSLDNTVWKKLFMIHPELNVPWYGVLGNHDYSYSLNSQKYCNGCKPCIAQTKEQFETQQCVASALLQHEGTGIIKDKNWRVRNGTWTVKDLGGKAGLIDLIMFDSNTQIEGYKTSSRFQPPVYGGIQAQDGNKVRADLAVQMRSSNATWRFVMGHHPLLSYGSRCVGELEDPKVQWNNFNKGDCLAMKTIRDMVFAEKIPIYLNGHDHMAELIKNDSTYMVVSGNGYKDSTVRSMNNADTQYLVYGNAIPRQREDGSTTYYKSDVGFNTIHVKDDSLVIKFWGIGYNQPPNVPANALSLHFDIKLDRKDFPYPGQPSPSPSVVAPSPQPAASPSPAQPAATPSPSAASPSPAAASPSPTPVAASPSPAVLSPSPVVSSPSPSPVVSNSPSPVAASPVSGK